MNSLAVAVVMDPIAEINPKKDTTLALMLAAQRRGHQLHYLELDDLSLRDGIAFGNGQSVTVYDDLDHWFDFGSAKSERPLGEFDVILMRKDPPFDMEFVFTTYLLELAEQQGAKVVNRPRGIRDANEKLFTAWFPELCPPTLVTRRYEQLRAFLSEHNDIVVKPLDGMGGASVFRVRCEDDNVGVIFETLTALQTRYCMAQRYLPEIRDGDKRVLMIDGEPVEYVLARIPPAGELRGNLAAGGTGEPRPISAVDRAICEKVGPQLRQRGLTFVGLDVIGSSLTEINVTSPTCVREIEARFDIDIGERLFEAIERQLAV
ncbi:MAG: glutathione synthase [Pseudomonadota bacterium]